jgi:hypothetical protein
MRGALLAILIVASPALVAGSSALAAGEPPQRAPAVLSADQATP